MAEVIGNPPSLSKQLAKQWKWVAVAVVVIALAIMSRNANIDLDGATPTGGECRVEVNADVLNVRAGPGAENASVGQLSRGEVVPAQSEVNNGFRKIGDNRWVATEFVTTQGTC